MNTPLEVSRIALMVKRGLVTPAKGYELLAKLKKV
jgi:hypothetical protein